MIESIILTIVAGVFLLGYKIYDPNKNMERHFHKHERIKYYALQLAVVILTFTAMFHGRHVLFFGFKWIWKLALSPAHRR